eukprot:4028232-Prymnesium_polylepis.1
MPHPLSVACLVWDPVACAPSVGPAAVANVSLSDLRLPCCTAAGVPALVAPVRHAAPLSHAPLKRLPQLSRQVVALECSFPRWPPLGVLPPDEGHECTAPAVPASSEAHSPYAALAPHNVCITT